MPDYYAVARKVGTHNAFTVQFSAKDTTDAIAELCAAAGVQNTNGLLEFEVLMIMEKGKYHRVALKEERKTTTEQRLQANQGPVTPPEPVVPKEPPAEKQYSQYTTAKAA